MYPSTLAKNPAVAAAALRLPGPNPVTDKNLSSRPLSAARNVNAETATDSSAARPVDKPAFDDPRISGVSIRQRVGVIVAKRRRRPMPKTVLIVEDNELNMKLFNDLVETRGHRIVQTRNGIEAVELARKYRPDLILMDIQLPEVSGLEVTQWLKDDDELRAIPVVAITAFAMKGDEDKILQGGCEAYLSKPISVARFFETIDHFLGARPKAG
jgi:two-component system cell cycle response regulator DivK